MNNEAKRKVIIIAISILGAAVIALSTLQLLGIWSGAINVLEPLLGVMMLLQAVFYWEKDRKTAIFSLCAALFILAVAVAVILPRYI